MMFNLTAELDVEATADTADRIVTELEGFHPAVGVGYGGRAHVTISLQAETLGQAIALAIPYVEQQTGTRVLAIENAMPSDEFDRRNGLDPVPELLSVTEIAEEYGISRQAVNGLIERGRFATARRVGTTWAVSRQEVLATRPRTSDEHAAAIARGAAKR